MARNDDGDISPDIDTQVTNLDSTKTQLAYDYYTLPFCKPDDIVEASENLGEVMSGT